MTTGLSCLRFSNHAGTMTQSLSLPQARKLVLLSQRVPPARQTGSATAVTLAAIEHLGYVQIDTISVIQRAHHHTLWNRNPRYRASQLDQLIADKQVFEYWSHAAAYLPMCDYRFSLPRKQAIARGDENHWYTRDTRLMDAVLKRIADEGPLMARDFEHTGTRRGDWHSKPAKQALENLYMQGALMSARRENFHKVYDVTERVLPPGTDTRMPSPEEYARFLITRFLRAHGLGQAAEIAYLLKNTKPLITHTVQDMLASGELQSIRVAGKDYVTLPDALSLLDRPLARNTLKILSPFDNLLIQRKRMQALFGFDYLIECYVPKAKRQFGYFSLPILWDGKLVARMDCKADRKTSALHLYHLALEPRVAKVEAFCQALAKALVPFLAFNQCTRMHLHRTSPQALEPVIRAVLGASGVLDLDS